MYKKPQDRIPPAVGGQSRAEIYNQGEGECRWPFNVFGQVEECSFTYDTVKEEKSYAVIKMPKGIVIYHSTQILGGATASKKGWWETRFPSDTAHGGVWFTSTARHADNFTTKTHTLAYTLVKDMYLIFVQNLSAFGPGVRGYEFVSKTYALLKANSEEYPIVGYLSCNECEIFIENDALEEVVAMPPQIIKERTNAYID